MEGSASLKSFAKGGSLPHTCHILPPSAIDLGLCLAVLQAQEGNIYFTESAGRVEYGNYEPRPDAVLLVLPSIMTVYIYIYIYI